MARRGFHVRRVHKRGTFWARSPADGVVTALANATAVLDSSAVPVVEGETIIRTRGMISVKSDQASASEQIVGAVGMCIVSDQAFAVGVGSVPTPFTDQDSDLWFMHQYFTHAIDFSDATGTQTQAFSTFHFDSKGMRKFVTGTTLAVVVENGSTVFAMNYFLNYAILFKVA